MLRQLLLIFVSGWILLGWAILLNALANRLDLATWYTVLTRVQKKLRYIDWIWLLVLYPLLLGCGLLAAALILV